MLNYTQLNRCTERKSNEYPKEFYSFADKIELLDNNRFEIHFDSIKREDFDNYLENDSFLMESDLYNIVLEISQNNLNNLFPNIDEIENAWFKVNLTNNINDFTVSLFVDPNINETGVILYISYINSIQKISPKDLISERLKGVFSLNKIPEAKIDEIKEALEFPGNDEKYVNIYNVGQGNLTSVCNKNNIPLVYIDLGGGCYRNTYTYPKLLELCYTSFKTIIFTHWDGDHIWTAHKAYQKIENKTIIVPRQTLNVTQTKFLKRLQNNGNKILVFPTKKTRIDTQIGTLVSCSGTTKNDSGIAIFIISRFNNQNFKILIPGDAAFKYIDHLDDVDLKIGGLLATHHGANFEYNNSHIPKSELPHWIIYSFGLGNSYNHAKENSIKAYYEKNWINTLTTLNGNVTFQLLDRKLNQPCNNRCSLSITNGFNE